MGFRGEQIVMGRGLVKYDGIMRSRLIELAAQGFTDYEIAKMLGISRHTIRRWKERFEDLKPAMEEAFTSGFKDAIYRGLRALCAGVEVSEETQEYIIEDAEGRPIKHKKKVTKHAADIRALKLVAKKFCPELDLEDTTSTTNILNIDSMTYRELLDYRATNNVLDIVEGVVGSSDSESNGSSGSSGSSG